jgi:hypothetical protein
MGIELNKIFVVNLYPENSRSIVPIVKFEDLLKPKTDPGGLYAILASKYTYSKDTTYNPAGKLNSIDYRQYLQIGNLQVKNMVNTIVTPADTNDQKADKILIWVQENIPYVSDEAQYHVPEYWAKPTETLKSRRGDCVAEYEEIYTSKGLKKVGDLKLGDFVLSYNFESKNFCYKPIVNIWEKGKLPVYRVRFRNGTWVDITEDHPFWVRRTYKPNPYVKVKLKDIDLTRWWTRKIPCVKKLPYKVKDIKWLTKDLCFVIGHFLAEGDIDKSHVRTSGFAIPEKIVSILKNSKVPYSITKNNSGVPYLSFLKSKFKDYLKLCVTNSFNIHLPEEIFYLPEDKLKSLIDGHFLGDGHYSAYKNSKNPLSQNNKEKTYSTSSNQLAFDIHRIHLQLGTPIYMWLQTDHKGFGNKPIWRLSYNSNSDFSKDFGFNGLSEVSIKDYEYIRDTEVRDFEVKDTHNFVFKNGIITHNCEDQSFLTHSMLLAAGVPVDRVRTYGGLVEAGINAPLGGHAWTIYKRESDNQWVDLDACYYPDNTSVVNKETFKAQDEYVDAYWWMNGYGTYNEYGKWGINIYA